jgi:hypothetical protein
VIINIHPDDPYHEGGHAAMYWHYGIPLDYVSVEPDLEHGYGGITKPLPRPAISGRTELEAEMRISAAGDAAERHIQRPRPPVLEAKYLISQFNAAVADLQANPNSSIHSDWRNFACTALARDEENRKTGLDRETGPASWVPVWLEAGEMIRDSLWPAVEAIADALIVCTQPHVIGGERAAALMTAAMIGSLSGHHAHYMRPAYSFRVRADVGAVPRSRRSARARARPA